MYRAIVGSISGQYYYEFGVNETWQSGLVWSGQDSEANQLVR